MGRNGLVAAATGLALLASGLAAPGAWAGDGGPPGPWTFEARAFLTGKSDQSDPSGYVVYSALGLEAGLARRLSPRLSAALTLRTESREVDLERSGEPAERLGSIEFLPVSLLIRYHLRPGGSLHPYLGAGANLTVAWEKSGALDSAGVSPGVGPALELGADLDVGPAVLWNLDLRWNAHRTGIDFGSGRTVDLTLDTVVLGTGIGFRF